MTSTELLNTLRNDVSDLISETERDYIHLPDHILKRKPAPTAWSILECFEHLNRYNRFYNAEIERRLAPSETTLDHQVSSTWLGKKSIQSMHPSNTKKQKTLKHMNPLQSALERTVIEEFLSHQRAFLKILDRASGSDLNKVRIPIEFFRLLKLNLGDALQFVVAHEQRHFIQIARTLKEIGVTTDGV
jgi:uncharacterized damage-inducible protein DinB